MTLDRWLAYVAVLAVVCITPGPAVILTSAQAAARGVRSSLAIIAGVQAGNLIYFLLSAIGLGAIIVASETAFLLIKYAGGGYLIYLGVRAFFSPAAAAGEQPSRQHWRRVFVHGIAAQLANPKSVLFYVALLPQFIVPGPDLVRQLLILGVTDVVVEVPILATYAALAARGGAYVGGSAWRERLTGSALIAAGAAVLLARRSG
jgi:homoserine/homoserine lactone efflux protein